PGDIATEAGLTLAELQAEFGSKTAILVGILRSIDAQMLASLPAAEVGDSARDRLFGVIMARLDVMRPYRRAVIAVTTAAACDPRTACSLFVAQRQSLAWMLEAAGISSAGLRGALLRKGLRLVMAS